MLSKQVPLGLGIAVGAFANHMIGRTIVGTARKFFGPAPEFFDPQLDSVLVEAEWVQAAGEEERAVLRVSSGKPMLSRSGHDGGGAKAA